MKAKEKREQRWIWKSKGEALLGGKSGKYYLQAKREQMVRYKEKQINQSTISPLTYLLVQNGRRGFRMFFNLALRVGPAFCSICRGRQIVSETLL